jgi:ubiquinone/menaquinone biosynthesis C-methylase UbiE
LATAEKLPDYEPMLADYHRAYAPELRAMVGSLPLGEGDRVLEVACGDGFYARRLAERLGPSGRVVAVDVLPAYLEQAARDTDAAGTGPAVGFVAAALERLPFDDDTFDLVWSAQSLHSLPEPVEAVRRMARVVRPGGVVAVLENDTLHHILLPWPVEVELEVRRAELVGLAEETGQPRKFYVGRELGEVFRRAGLGHCRTRTWATNRQAPLGPAERGFLEKYLADLRDRARPHLDPATRERVDRLCDPSSDAFLLDGPDLTVTCLDHVVCGTKPNC